MIAAILARNTPLSVFDEPEAGIDLRSFNNLIKVFEKLHETDSDRSLTIISHQERILSIADEIVVIANGQVKARIINGFLKYSDLFFPEKSLHIRGITPFPRGKFTKNIFIGSGLTHGI